MFVLLRQNCVTQSKRGVRVFRRQLCGNGALMSNTKYYRLGRCLTKACSTTLVAYNWKYFEPFTYGVRHSPFITLNSDIYKQEDQ